MNITKTLHVTTRRAWRAWLSKHFRTAKEVWLVYYRKETGKSRIPYNDAVEEALCFGWIDSIVKKLDTQRFAQRFSPRRPNAPYSQANKVRLRRLIAQKKVRKDLRAALGNIQTEKFTIPPDILRAIKANAQAWRNFRKYSAAYQQIRIAFIDGARRRPQEFRKRLRYFLKMTEQGKQFGFGGIDKYF